MTTTPDKLREALSGMLNEHDRTACVHESVHRGGAIWTICDRCGAKWTDDEGGFKPYKDPDVVAAARSALAATPTTPQQAGALSEQQIEAAIDEWFGDRRRNFQERMRAAIAAAFPAAAADSVARAETGPISSPGRVRKAMGASFLASSATSTPAPVEPIWCEECGDGITADDPGICDLCYHIKYAAPAPSNLVDAADGPVLSNRTRLSESMRNIATTIRYSDRFSGNQQGRDLAAYYARVIEEGASFIESTAGAAPATAARTDDNVFAMVAEVLGNPLIEEDLKGGFAVHVEPEDWIKFARAIRGTPAMEARCAQVLSAVVHAAKSDEDARLILDENSPLMDAARSALLDRHAPATAAHAEASEIEQYLLSVLPSVYYMDPPDGGSVSLLEQLRRMADDAAKYRSAAQPVSVDAVPVAYWWMDMEGHSIKKAIGFEAPSRIPTSALHPLFDAAPPASTGADASQHLAHQANEWADVATNGLQWLKNLKDGTSNIDTAISDMKQNIERVRDLLAADVQPPVTTKGFAGCAECPDEPECAYHQCCIQQQYAKAAANAQAPVAPLGYALVPIEPTGAMVYDGANNTAVSMDEDRLEVAKEVYRAMVDAAPAQPAVVPVAVEETPWDDCKVAYSIADEEVLWAAWESGTLKFPTGWTLNETDCSGARAVAVFRVDVLPTIKDGNAALEALAASAPAAPQEPV